MHAKHSYELTEEKDVLLSFPCANLPIVHLTTKARLAHDSHPECARASEDSMVPGQFTTVFFAYIGIEQAQFVVTGGWTQGFY